MRFLELKVKIHNTIKTYLSARRAGIKRKAILKHLWQLGIIDEFDLSIILVLLIGSAINLTLLYAEKVYNAMLDYQAKAISFENKATHLENTLVSALNGSIVLNGRLKTVCILTASGDCEKHEAP